MGIYIVLVTGRKFSLTMVSFKKIYEGIGSFEEKNSRFFNTNDLKSSNLEKKLVFYWTKNYLSNLKKQSFFYQTYDLFEKKLLNKQFYLTNDFQKGIISQNERFNWMIVQSENDRNRSK